MSILDTQLHLYLMEIMKLIIDAGHTDALDPGAVANNTTEHAEVVRLAQYIVGRIPQLAEFSGYSVVMVPTGKSLTEKIQFINAQPEAALTVVSIHMNTSTSSGVSGTETYFLGGDAHEESQAQKVQQGVISVLGFPDRGVKADTTTRFGRLGIIRDTKCPAYLVEIGFITNLSDLQKVHAIGGDAIIQGIRSLLNLSTSSPVTPIPMPNNTLPSTVAFKQYEGIIDQIFAEGRDISKQETDLLKKRKDWDMKLDRYRGLLLAELDKVKTQLHPDLVMHETVTLKQYALDNNTLIADLETQLNKRMQWDSNVLQLRGQEVPLMPH